MIQILEITQDTVFKRRPLQSTELGEEEICTIAKGAKLELQSYAYADANGDDFDDHIKIALKNQQDYIKGVNTWYIYEPYAQVLQAGKIVYPHAEAEPGQLLKITQNTIFKRRPVQSSELAADEIHQVSKGASFELQSYAYAEGGEDFKDHIKFALEDSKDYIRGLSTWYVYEQHAQVLYEGSLVYPLSLSQSAVKPTTQSTNTQPTGGSGPTIKLPGYSGVFYLNQPISPNSPFTWAEATKNGTRIPTSKKVVDSMIALAKALEKPRDQLGRPFRVTSWYRDPASNARAGGARNSMHLYGRALDLQVVDYSQRQAAKDLDWWPGGLGSYSGWIHLDIGPRRRWRH